MARLPTCMQLAACLTWLVKQFACCALCSACCAVGHVSNPRILLSLLYTCLLFFLCLSAFLELIFRFELLCFHCQPAQSVKWHGPRSTTPAIDPHQRQSLNFAGSSFILQLTTFFYNFVAFSTMHAPDFAPRRSRAHACASCIPWEQFFYTFVFSFLVIHSH